MMRKGVNTYPTIATNKLEEFLKTKARSALTKSDAIEITMGIFEAGLISSGRTIGDLPPGFELAGEPGGNTPPDFFGGIGGGSVIRLWDSLPQFQSANCAIP